MERKGVRVDNERLSKAVPEAEEEIRAVERELAARVKIPASQLNLNSNQQLRDIFFSKLGLPPIKFTKGGTTGVRVPCVDEFVLEHYANKGVPEAVLVRKHREYSKLLGTYLLGLSEHMDHNNRIHSRLNQDVVRTGRLSSSAPNLQNIPRPENDKWGIREGFVPEKGKTFLCFDYSQLEMRLLAAASLEQSMLDMIHSGKDIHMGNAELVFGLPYADIQHAQDVKKKVGSGELPKEALTAYMKECLLARTATKSIGFGQPNNRPN
jgi:DNA polymerase-1